MKFILLILILAGCATSMKAAKPLAVVNNCLSPSGTTLPVAGTLCDGTNSWALVSGVVYENGVKAGFTQNVAMLLFYNSNIYQENTSNLWWIWQGGTWIGSKDPWVVTPPPPVTPSADKTLMPPAASIVDSSKIVWTVAGGIISRNGVADTTTINVTLVLYFGGVVYQENASGGFWSWTNGSWVQSTDPRGITPPVGGQFSIKNGQFIDPKGQVYVGRGIDVGIDDIGKSSLMLSLFKGLSFIRFAVEEGSYSDPSKYASFVNAMTAKGIVVEIEHHVYPSPLPYTGAALTAESNWYAALAKYYAGNPYVWFGTMNEPGDSGTYAGTGPGISAQHLATYNAIRGTGSKAILLMNYFGGGNPGSVGAGFGLTSNTYQPMTNVAWDLHFYGWVSKFQADMPTALAGNVGHGMGIAAAQTIKSADGVMPVLIGEFGDSSDGSNRDANWQQVISAVVNSGYGYAAWHFGTLASADILVDGSGNLTDYGKLVAAGIGKFAVHKPKLKKKMKH